jgi:uncharacterized protein YjbI with pentapeptide repeats
MANEGHLVQLKQRVTAWNCWRSSNPDITPDLAEADLIGANLAEVNLAEADLTEADLTRATLTEAHFYDTHLTGATLTGAHLHETTIGWTILGNVDMSTARAGLQQLENLRYVPGSVCPIAP